MAIDLSTLTFTNKADIIPPLGTAEIVNTGTAKTLGGNDQITGIGASYSSSIQNAGIRNSGTINTSNGNDTITATSDELFNGGATNGGVLDNSGTIDTGSGSDVIRATGRIEPGPSGAGSAINNTGSIKTGAGNDTITGVITGTGNFVGIFNQESSTINTGCGNDTIIGTGPSTGLGGILNEGIINTGDGNDSIIGNSDLNGIVNRSIINTGNGNDLITGNATSSIGDGGSGILNSVGTINTGAGNDTIIGTGDVGIYNSPFFSSSNSIIDTGAGNDTIIGTGDIGIYNSPYNFSNSSNSSIINTGAGNDIIIGNGLSVGIYNDGIINTGTGNDIVDALKGGFSSFNPPDFGSIFNGLGIVLLGDGNDVLKGFGTGRFDGEDDFDTLLLGAGEYTVSGITNADGFYTVNNGTTDMFVKNFEFIGSASNPAAAFSFSSVIGETFMV
jgi:hypothetical protein